MEKGFKFKKAQLMRIVANNVFDILWCLVKGSTMGMECFS